MLMLMLMNSFYLRASLRYDGCVMSIVFSSLKNERVSATVTLEKTEENSDV